MSPILYAKVGGPPKGWKRLRITELDTGQEIRMVTEVDARNGWLTRYKLNDEGRAYPDPDLPDEAAKERITGRFKIEPIDPLTLPAKSA